MKSAISALLNEFNQLHKEMDIIYHNYAKSYGLSDTGFWILYCVSENNGSLTQRELCSDWSLSPQTVNSALKSLESQGIITLEAVPDNKKNKLIKLSEMGLDIVNEVIIPLMQVESESFTALTDEECSQMLSTTKKHVSILNEKIGAITKPES